MMRIRKMKPLVAVLAATGTVCAFAPAAHALTLPGSATAECATDVRVWKVFVTFTNVDTQPVTLLSLTVSPAYPIVGIGTTIAPGTSVTGTISGIPDGEAAISIDYQVRFGDGTTEAGGIGVDRPGACDPPPPPPPPPTTTTTTAAPTTTTTTAAPTTLPPTSPPTSPPTTAPTSAPTSVATTTTSTTTTTTAAPTSVPSGTTTTTPASSSSSSVVASSSSSAVPSTSSSVPRATTATTRARAAKHDDSDDRKAYRRRPRRDSRYEFDRERLNDRSSSGSRGDDDERASVAAADVLAELQALRGGGPVVASPVAAGVTGPVSHGPVGGVAVAVVVLGSGLVAAGRRRRPAD